MNFERFRAIQAENAELCERKNRVYGDRSLKRFGAVGIVVRMMDKAERLATMVVENKVSGGPVTRRIEIDSIIDAFRDMANYATMGQMFEEGTFDEPEVGHEPNARGRNRRRVGRRGSRRAP